MPKELTPRDIITGPETWCQGYYAKDKDGRPVSALSSDAVCFCMSGAAERTEVATEHWDALQEFLYKRYGFGIVTFNDSPETTIEMVLAVLAEVFPRKEAE